MSGLLEQAKDGVNYVANTIAGEGHKAEAEGHKQAVKSDQTSIGQKVDSGLDYLGAKKDQHSAEAQAEVDKQKATH